MNMNYDRYHNNNDTYDVNQMIILFDVAYLSLVYGIISDKSFMIIHDHLNSHGFKAYSHSHYVNLCTLISNTFTQSHIYMVIIYLRHTCEFELYAMRKVFRTIDDVFTNRKRMTTIERYLKVKTKMEKLMTKLAPFSKKESFSDIAYILCDPSFDEKKLKEHDIIEYWNYYNRDDYITRLYDFGRLFNLCQLLYLDIDIKHARDLADMSKGDIEKYYNNVIQQAYDSLKRLIVISDACIDVELAYIKLISNLNTDMSINKTNLKLTRHNITIHI